MPAASQDTEALSISGENDRVVFRACDKVVFSVSGQKFEVPVPNLRSHINPNSFLFQLLDEHAGDDNVPIEVPGANADLFQYILSIQRYGECAIPANITRSDILREARQVFRLAVSAEDIFQDGDSHRDGGKSSFERNEQTSRFGTDFTHELTLTQTSQAADYFHKWSVENVSDWLQSIHGGRLSGHVAALQANKIDGKALACSTHDTLKSLGISNPKTRQLLLVAIFDAPTAQEGLDVDKVAPRQLDIGLESGEHPGNGYEHEQLDAAALNLNKIFGANGTTQMFTDVIKQWQQKHLQECTGTSSDQVAKKIAKNGILVASRVRPLLSDGPDRAAVELGDFEAVSMQLTNPPKVTVHACGSQLRDLVEHKSFAVHRTLDQACCELDVFGLAKPLIEASVSHDVHVTLLCYGQTGTGKTHSVGHLAEHTIQHLFTGLDVQKVALEAFELAGGAKGLVQSGSHVYSLIADGKPELLALEGPDGAVHVGGSNAVVRGADGQLNLDHCMVASNPEELSRIFRAAEARRSAKDTHRNAESSRTHAFYRFHVLETSLSQATGSCVQLVDLAGSESNKDCLYHDKERIDERAQINASLMALCSCIQKHAEGASYIPFRSSKLTQILRPCFVKRADVPSGTATVLFLSCISPLASDSQQSIRTLGFTQTLAGMPSGKDKKPMPRAFVAIKEQLCRAVASGDVNELRGAVLIAKQNGAVGVCGIDYRRATAALDKLETEESLC